MLRLSDEQKVQIFCAALSATAQTRNDGNGAKRGFENDPVEEAFKLIRLAVARLEAQTSKARSEP
jgi:hypothetical protein